MPIASYGGRRKTLPPPPPPSVQDPYGVPSGFDPGPSQPQATPGMTGIGAGGPSNADIATPNLNVGREKYMQERNSLLPQSRISGYDAGPSQPQAAPQSSVGGADPGYNPATPAASPISRYGAKSRVISPDGTSTGAGPMPPASGGPPDNADYLMGGGPQGDFGASGFRTPYQPDLETDDINRMWRDNRQSQFTQGQDIDKDIQGQEKSRQFEEGQYRGLMNNAYGDLSRTPGYTADESNGIQRTDQYGNLITPDSAYNDLSPSDEEFAGEMGDVNKFGSYLTRDKIAQMEQADRESASYQRDAYGRAAGGQKSAIDEQAGGYDKAIDRSKLSIGDYGKRAANTLASGESAVRGTINKDDLSLSKDFAGKYNMSDADVQGEINKAATNVQNSYGAAKDDLTRSAMASGNADALAVAAGRSRLEHQSAADASDSMTNARIAAKAEQAARLGTSESMRLNAAGTYAGLASTNEQALAARRLASEADTEKMREGTEQDISNRGMTAATNIGNAKVGAAQYGGALETGVESGIGGQAASTGRYVVDTGTKIATDEEKTQAARWNDYYKSRAGLGQYGIDTKFGQGVTVADKQAAGAKAVADARLAGQREYRGWSADQTGQQLQAGQTATGQRIQNYGVQSGAVNNSTSGLSSWEAANQGNTALKKVGATLKGVGQFASSMAGAGRSSGGSFPG